jgi:hypothetical protein
MLHVAHSVTAAVVGEKERKRDRKRERKRERERERERCMAEYTNGFFFSRVCYDDAHSQIP